MADPFTGCLGGLGTRDPVQVILVKKVFVLVGGEEHGDRLTAIVSSRDKLSHSPNRFLNSVELNSLMRPPTILWPQSHDRSLRES